MAVRGKIQLRNYRTGIRSEESVAIEARIVIGVLAMMKTLERKRKKERRKEERGEMRRKGILSQRI